MRQKDLNPILAIMAIGLAVARTRPAPRAPQPPLRPVQSPEGRNTAGRAAEPGRGRAAESPTQIPPRGWKDILIRTWREFRDDQIPMIAAGMSFYALLALFPGIGAFAAIWGLFADLGDAQRDLQRLALVLPGGAITLIGDQLKTLAASHEGGLSLAAAVGVLLSLWSANGAMKAVITGLNIAYDEVEARGLVAKTLTSLGFTLGFLAFSLCGAAVLVGQPAVARIAGERAALVLGLVAWPVLFGLLVLGLAILYRYGPSRDRAKWRWISWGSVLAALGWLLASLAFSFYVGNFGHYDKTYGPLGAAVGFMTWTWISGMVVLLGAELNSEMEHQTAKDSTVGPPEPLGMRGATMADTVGAAQGRSAAGHP